MLHRRLARPVVITVLLTFICYFWLAAHSNSIVFVSRSDIGIAEEFLLFPATETTRGKSQVPARPKSRIGKATVAANSLNSTIIHQALRTHRVQNELHGYIHHIATEELVGDLSENDNQGRPRGAWSKPAYLLSLVVNELTKPQSERLEWLFWFDADTIVMNPHTPLEIFLPPNTISETANIHLLIATNWDGLNSGAFAFRIHPWSVSVLSAILAYPLYRADLLKNDRFRDQSAFQWLLQSPESFLVQGHMGGTENWADVPMRWFNSLPINNAFSSTGDWIFDHEMNSSLFDNGTRELYQDGNGRTVQPWKVMRGDMVVHFAGSTNVRDSWMGPWLERAEKYLPAWSNVTRQVELRDEAKFFWNITASRIMMARKHEMDKAMRASEVHGLFHESPPGVILGGMSRLAEGVEKTMGAEISTSDEVRIYETVDYKTAYDTAVYETTMQEPTVYQTTTYGTTNVKSPSSSAEATTYTGYVKMNPLPPYKWTT